MKKTLLLLLLILATTGANAQWKIGRVKQDFKINDDEIELTKDLPIAYNENKNGTTTVFRDGPECTNYILGTYSKDLISKNVEFTGYYWGAVKDPTDDFVNVRKGPGTNYPVVGKLWIGCEILFMKTDNNWLKVYHTSFEKTRGFFECFCSLRWFTDQFLNDDGMYYFNTNSINHQFHFIGYIYKDRIESPIAD